MAKRMKWKKWKPSELKYIKKNAGKISGALMAQKFGRSSGAVYQKCFSEGISLS